MKKWVFNCLLKDVTESLFLIEIGRLFHNLGPATEKARSPYVLREVFGILKVSLSLLERRLARGWYKVRSSVRYEGAFPFSALKTRRRILKSIRFWIGSQ